MKKEKRKLVSFTLDLSTTELLDNYSKNNGINKSRIVEDALKRYIEVNDELSKLDILNYRISIFKELQSIGGFKKDWLLKNILKVDEYEG